MRWGAVQCLCIECGMGLAKKSAMHGLVLLYCHLKSSCCLSKVTTQGGGGIGEGAPWGLGS